MSFYEEVEAVRNDYIGSKLFQPRATGMRTLVLFRENEGAESVQVFAWWDGRHLRLATNGSIALGMGRPWTHTLRMRYKGDRAKLLEGLR